MSGWAVNISKGSSKKGTRLCLHNCAAEPTTHSALSHKLCRDKVTALISFKQLLVGYCTRGFFIATLRLWVFTMSILHNNVLCLFSKVELVHLLRIFALRGQLEEDNVGQMWVGKFNYHHLWQVVIFQVFFVDFMYIS